MLKVIITLIIFNFSVPAVGQGLSSIYKNQIKLSPLRIVDIVNPGIEVNYERSHSKKFSSELSAAYMGNIVRSGNFFEGFRIGLEEKRFLKTRITNVRAYVSTQLVYNNSVLKDVNNYGYDTSTRTYINAPFRIAKKTAAFNVKVGLEFLLRRFVVDYSTGFGIKYREVKHIGRKYPYPESKGWNFFSNAERSSWNINFPATIKLGYSF